ncbi:MAG: ATP-binding cassette domain-containing protein [Bacteroidales bacterium]|nr:ATP-binding cassette domain-containing protein [Bacteroidales bacterium]
MERIEIWDVVPEPMARLWAEELDQRVWHRDLELRRGQYYLLETESGRGKSSLCSFLYGLRDDYRGQILFDGQDIRRFSRARWAEIRRNEIALLPQEMRLFPELTVMENIQLKNRLTHHKTPEQISAMLSALEVEGKADNLVSQLSIGQQQRVAIVRTLCQPFSFLLLDEPVSHLDARCNELASQLILAEASAQSAGILVTSVGNPLSITNLSNL